MNSLKLIWCSSEQCALSERSCGLRHIRAVCRPWVIEKHISFRKCRTCHDGGMRAKALPEFEQERNIYEAMLLIDTGGISGSRQHPWVKWF